MRLDEFLFGRKITAREFCVWAGAKNPDLWLRKCVACSEEFIISPELAKYLNLKRCKKCRLENRPSAEIVAWNSLFGRASSHRVAARSESGTSADRVSH